MSFQPLLFLPCAGYGKRAGSPPAKEMLLDSKGRPLIEYWLDLAREQGWPSHILTRKEKTNLISFVQSRQSIQRIHLQIISPTRDISETLLQGQNFWSEYNIVALPDTQFAPKEALKDLSSLLRQFPSAYATIENEKPHEFGGLLLEPERTGIFEKCAPATQKKIWGIFGFQRKFGQQLINAHLQSALTRRPAFVDWESAEVLLDHFSDLTRN